ncbi:MULTISPECIES: phage integrase Arm DNA-binding domain-containing protein [unclassified Pseudomonas]|nr:MULTISPECIES: phage integrase Arm DNA-binding domain-containing protein [unclassified Pseudomonas]
MAPRPRKSGSKHLPPNLYKKKGCPQREDLLHLPGLRNRQGIWAWFR